MGKKWIKAFFWVLILVLLVLPLGLIARISSAELVEYAAGESPVIRQSAIGAPVQARRMDLQLSVSVTGTFVATEVAFMELEYAQPSDIRWIVSFGEEIQQGQVLGYYQGTAVTATVEGIIESIHTTAGNAYIMVRCFSPLELECNVTDEDLEVLRQYADALRLEDGTAVTLTYISKIKNFDETTTVRLSLDRDGDSCGVTQTLPIFFGVGYPQVLVLPTGCVYQKNAGAGEPWYVRQVSEDGLLIGETQVTIAYFGDTWAVVSGIQEGQWFDSGYKAAMGG